MGSAPPPPGKSQVIWVSIEVHYRTRTLFCVLGLILLQMSTETLSGWTRWVIAGCIIGIKSSAIIALFHLCELLVTMFLYYYISTIQPLSRCFVCFY